MRRLPAQPLIDSGFAFEPLDVLGFDAWTFGDNLPVVRCDPLHFEGDSGRFAHAILYGPVHRQPLGLKLAMTGTGARASPLSSRHGGTDARYPKQRQCR